MATAKRSSRQRGVYKRGDTWCIRFSHNGKIHREAIGTYDQAVKAYHARKLQIANGTLEKQYGVQGARKQAPTFNEFADRFLVEYCDAPGNKPSLKRFYVNSLVSLRKRFGPMRLDQISTWHVRKFKSERAKEKHWFTGNPLSPKTINRELAALRRMLNVAKQWEVINANPCDGVPLFTEMQSKAEFLYPAECRALIDAAEDYFKPIPIVALHTGMRKEEILGLTWDQVDFDRNIIRLDEGKTVKTTPEYVPMSGTVVETLSSMPRASKFVFQRRNGVGRLRDVRKPLMAALEGSGIAEQRKRLGKPPLRFHDLRHTTASLMVISGHPLEAPPRPCYGTRTSRPRSGTRI